MREETTTIHKVGDQMPALSLADINGGEIELVQFGGKKYIIYMWASW